MRYLIVLMLLTGCVMRVPADAGRRFTVQHDANFQGAMREAERHCATMGMRAVHLGSDYASLSLSRFECEQR